MSSEKQLFNALGALIRNSKSYEEIQVEAILYITGLKKIHDTSSSVFQDIDRIVRLEPKCVNPFNKLFVLLSDASGSQMAAHLLYLAVDKNYPELVKALLDAGADPVTSGLCTTQNRHFPTQLRKPAFGLAVEKGSIDIAKLFIATGKFEKNVIQMTRIRHTDTGSEIATFLQAVEDNNGKIPQASSENVSDNRELKFGM